MATPSNDFIVMLILAIIASLPGILTFFSQRKSASADYVEKITGSAVQLVEAQENRINELEGLLKGVQIELAIEKDRREQLEQALVKISELEKSIAILKQLLSNENEKRKGMDIELREWYCKVLDLHKQISELEKTIVNLQDKLKEKTII